MQLVQFLQVLSQANYLMLVHVFYSIRVFSFAAQLHFSSTRKFVHCVYQRIRLSDKVTKNR